MKKKKKKKIWSIVPIIHKQIRFAGANSDSYTNKF